MDKITIIHAPEYIRGILAQIQVCGPTNARLLVSADNALQQMGQVLKRMGEEVEKEKEAAAAADLEQRKEARAKQLAEAEARGETVVGGQTVRINEDGTMETVIE